MSRPTKPVSPDAAVAIEVARVSYRLAEAELTRYRRAVLEARKAGASFAAIAEGIGITPQAVSQAVKRRQR